MQKRSLTAIVVALALSIPVLVAGCSGSGSSVPPPTGIPQKSEKVSVFFSTGRSLFEEKRVVDATDLYGATLKELLEARPVANPNVAIVQPTAKPLSVTLKKGVLTIDWPRDILKFDAEPKEKVLALASILRTFGQFPEVKKVRFTVEGKTKGKVDGRDVEAFWGRVSLKGEPWNVLRPSR